MGPGTRKVDMLAEPNGNPVSFRHDTSRPDFFFILKDKRSVVSVKERKSWMDIVCSGEVKVKNSTASQVDVSSTSQNTSDTVSLIFV